MNVKNINAVAIQTDEGLVVLPNSEVSIEDSQHYAYKNFAKILLKIKQ